jgi:hemerythrin-like metal-binding protein
MAYLNWSADYETGIDLIDQDHKVLVELLNQAYDCIGTHEETVTLGSVLNALIDYTEYHFAREERLMEAAGYPDVAPHRALHRDLTGRARGIRERYTADPDSVAAREVMEFLRDWLINHILKQDFRYRQTVMAAPEAMRKAEAEQFGGPAPMARGDTETAPVAAPLNAGVAFEDLAALVVDDNPNFRIILRTILKGLGCPSITLANDARQGLVALEAGTPSLILVDWRMDGMDGLDFVRHVRASGIEAPIVMISGYGEPGFSDIAAKAGVDAFLEKPITARGLSLAVSRAMAARTTATG